MNRVNLLYSINRAMMEDFSRQTIEDLRNHALFRLVLPSFRNFLDINVAKEIEKNRRVITSATSLYQSGARPDQNQVETLLQESREIDQEFLKKAATLPVNFQIHYREIELIRQQRIELLLLLSYNILSQWHEKKSFRSVVSNLFDETELQNQLHNMLKLYAEETRILSRSVHMPHLFTLARDAVTQAITSVMKQKARTLSKSMAFKAFNTPGRVDIHE